MATDLGTSIRRARERKRWTQQQLADALGVNIKTVDNWENSRTSPRSSIGAIELALDVNLTSDQSVTPYVTPDEALIWSLDRFSPDERRALIRALREVRGD
jgi:transcriptional regulator with XRE-family HTH domain